MLKKIKLLKERISKSDIGTRMANGAFWSFTGTVCAKMVILVSGIICAHILGQAEYGELGMIRSTINMFVVVGFAGIGITATKYISEYRKEQKSRISSIYILTNGFALIMGVIVTSLVYILSPFLAESVLNSPQLTKSLKFGALLLFVTIINGAQNGILVGFENFKAIALNTLYSSLAEGCLMLLGALWWGVNGAIFGFGLGFIVLYLSNKVSIQRTFKREKILIERHSFKSEDLKILITFSLPAALSTMMVAPTYWIVRTFLVRNAGFEELAIYEVADQWKIIILFIPTAISQIVLPILSSMQGDWKSEFWKVLRLNIIINVIVTGGFVLFIILLSPFILNLYGSQYTNTSTIIVLSISTVFTAIANVVGVSISSRSKMWVGFSFNLLWAIIFVSLSYIFVGKNFGALGIALALLISYVIHSILQFIYLRKLLK